MVNHIQLNQSQTWQSALANAITDPAELLQILELDPALLNPAKQAAQLFPLRVPRSYIARMQKGNPIDPLLRQILPLGIELDTKQGFTADPLQEKATNPLPGLLHKYHGRVLLTLVGSCGVNCRYCFRRSFPYQENNPGRVGWDKVLHYISQDPNITEVILSGGDPLVASDHFLAELGEKLIQIKHLKTLRFHTRMPIALPDRITNEFTHWLATFPLRKVMVLHCNHPQELNAEVYEALHKLHGAKITLLNQAVLLKDINDQASTLINLSEALFSGGVLPYYLNLLDKVQGTAHFEVSEAIAKNLIKEISEKLPGYLVPRLMREIPGAKSKIQIS